MPRKPAATRPITMQPETPSITFEELRAEFIRFKKLRNLAPDTIKFYEDCGRYLADFFGGDVPCQSISEDTYYSYIEYLHKTKPDLKPATERSYLTGIRAILYYGMKKEYIPKFAIQLPKMDEVVKEITSRYSGRCRWASSLWWGVRRHRSSTSSAFISSAQHSKSSSAGVVIPIFSARISIVIIPGFLSFRFSG